MPRPGPRPYECVRRAWHSDRHQPMRGSLIQELFRIVNESHSEAIRKNKEWQEKLPVVVLKAEEIMYSKANSEAEYMDLTTLWERANDAVDTIIRRDETEDGKFLQPCIEAALNLGCTPRRASRSQRHNSRCYLASTTQQNAAGTVAPKNPKYVSVNLPSMPQPGDSVANLRLIPYYLPQFPPRPIISPLNQRCPFPVPGPQYHFRSEISPFTVQDPRGSSPLSATGRACALHFSSNPAGMMHFDAQEERQPNRSHLNLGPFQSQRMTEVLELPENSDREVVPTNRRSRGTTVSAFDLSLRLAPSSTPCVNSENGWDDDVEDLGSSNSQGGRIYTEFSPTKTRLNSFSKSFSSQERDKEFSFFPVNATDENMESCSSRWSSEAEIVGFNSSLGKRKSNAGDSFRGNQLFWNPLLSVDQFSQGTKKPHC